MKKLWVLLSGNGSNMEALVRECREGVLRGKAEVIAVLSNRKDALGLEKARKLGIKTHLLLSKGKSKECYDAELAAFFREQEFDFIVLAGFMRVLGSQVIQMHPDKILNIHPADTSRHQGMGGYEWAFSSALKETWITVHFVDEGLDTGKVIAKERVDLSGCESLDEVKQRGLAVEHLCYSKAIARLVG